MDLSIQGVGVKALSNDDLKKSCGIACAAGSTTWWGQRQEHPQ